MNRHDTDDAPEALPSDGRDFVRVRSCNAAWREVLRLGTRRAYAKGAVVIASGSVCNHLYFLDRGEVRMVRTGPDGNEKILWHVEEGTIFGETPFIDGLVNRSNHICTQPSIIHAFSRERVLKEIFPARPDLMLGLMRTLAMKVRVLSNQIANLSLDDLPARICKFLYMHCGGVPDSCGVFKIRPGVTQQELASLLGVHRVTLNKALKELEKNGILEGYGQKEVRILDRQRFLEYALSEV